MIKFKTVVFGSIIIGFGSLMLMFYKSRRRRSKKKYIGNFSQSIMNYIEKMYKIALLNGQIQSIETNYELLPLFNKIPCIIRIIKSLSNKPKNLKKNFEDPFFNPESKPLYICQITDSHCLMLNKYNVSKYHVLIVTNKFENQTNPLTANDWNACCKMLNAIDGLIYYNCGKDSGSSQPHKHLQFIPLPLLDEVPVLPIQQMINLVKKKRTIVVNELFKIEGYNFQHAAFLLDDQLEVEQLKELYQLAITTLSIKNQSYNILLTRRFLLVVPRKCESYKSIGINSVGFSGTLLVKKIEDLEVVRLEGALNILQNVSYN